VDKAPTWVVGAGGLLGGHVAEAFRRQGHPVLRSAVPWHDRQRSTEVLRAGVETLLDDARGGAWNIAWCAGMGVMATSESDLAAEESMFAEFTRDLASALSRRSDATRGAVFFASSAGGVYAGSPGRPPYDEGSVPMALAPYGVAKLAMESYAKALASTTSTAVLIGRIANLYGPGQNLTKQQGLVSQMCRSVLTGQPLSIYVSLDTLRDYVFADDCADMVVAGLSGVRARAGAGGTAVTKIFASGRATTIGSLLSEGHRVLKRRPRVMIKAPSSSVQARDLRLRSVLWPELDRCARTSLAVGIARTAEDVSMQLRSPKRLLV
jgi:UDP-glucose 4-epimerase